MPNIIGGDQFDEDYAPHLWYKGKLVGEEEANRLKERDKQLQITLARNLSFGVYPMSTEEYRIYAKNSTYEKSGPWEIRDKEGNLVGALNAKGYVEVRYGDGSGIATNREINLAQIRSAREFSVRLRELGCMQLIEVPSPKDVLTGLEEILSFMPDLILLFK